MSHNVFEDLGFSPGRDAFRTLKMMEVLTADEVARLLKISKYLKTAA
ncbi:MAG TPA: hypothetical protein VGV15_05485 [Terriglobales bacterium]|nr:hypothetical protein [Terriglobales bacterium]